MDRLSPRMRILALLPEFPYPAHSGATMRMWHLLKNLGQSDHLTLVCRSRDPIDSANLSRLLEEKIEVKALHIPRPSLYEKLRKGVSFLVTIKPVSTGGWYFSELSRLIAHMIRICDFDVIIMESSMMGVYLPSILKSNSRAIKILDLMDMNSERVRRQAAITPFGVDKLSLLYDSLLLARYENRLIELSDIVMTISDRERHQIRKKHPKKQICLVPNGVDCDNIRILPLTQKKELLFVGIMDYLPNIDAILSFVRGVLPLIRSTYRDLRLWVVGKNPVPEIRRLNGIDGLVVTGEVSDLSPYYMRSSASIVPLRAGSGSRVKILEAMAYGRPVISTSLGCEGLDVKHREHLFIANSSVDMVKSIGRVFEGGDDVKAMVQNARNLVEERYSWSNIAKTMHGHLLQSVERSSSAQ